MTGRNNRKYKRGGEGRKSPSKTVLERDSPSPSNYRVFDSSFERSSPIFIQSRGSSSSDSEDEGILPYAGAKFNIPPPADVLPSPPMSWLGTSPHSPVEQVALHEMSSHLRQLLNVS